MLNSPAFRLIGLGFSFAFWTGGGALLGHYLDGRLGTASALTVILLLLGLGLGCYDAYRRLKELVTATDQRRRPSRRE